MHNNIIEQLTLGMKKAYIDGSLAVEGSYKPEFISNNSLRGQKVLASIREELIKCDSFQISVAFITDSGFEPLSPFLSELEEKGIHGRILTTDYLCFSEPKALRRLQQLKNISVKMFDTEAARTGFHTKGYIFNRQNILHIIIGSSNITDKALTANREWNIRIVSTDQGEMAQEITQEFEELWNSEYSYNLDQIIDGYTTRYEIIKKQRQIAKSEELVSLEKYVLKPNSMQEKFVEGLRRILEAGEDRALLISATGTGKTYASAFGMRELGFKRVLFVVHRNQLAEQAKKSYEKVFPNSVSMSIASGRDSLIKAKESDYIFAMVQTLSREENLQEFDPDAFDAIVLDETHHSPAASYQKIMKYFKPKLWLGMTATPDKRDDHIEGRNVYELFHHNIAHEIRLQQAMEDKLLCTFHYFGISDLTIIGDEEDNSHNFNMLTSDERVKHIVEKASYYGYSGDKVKGLIFCSKIKESQVLSDKLNHTINPDTGSFYRTVALNGDASDEERQAAFERLAADENNSDGIEPLDYILSVEILNEGVDIIEVNQVIMLRPTESPIVFIQQLGRGLRKAEGKEYVAILDFIGNYKNNFMIPIALSGDRTYNKDNYRRFVVEGCRVLPGESTIYFDEISRKKIFASIDKTNFSDVRLIRENYTNLKNKLGRIPALKDFDEYGEMDVLRIFDNNSLGSYYKFLVKYEKDYTIRLSESEEEVIEFISKKLASGKRLQELQMLKRMLDYSHGYITYGLFTGLAADMKANGKELSDVQKECIANVMTNEFAAGSSKATYSQCVLIEKSQGDYRPSESFSQMLQNEDFYNILSELVDFGISRYERDYKNTFGDSDLVLYQKYTYEDVCRLLNWEKNEVPLNIGGYKYDRKTKTFPVFINYEKAEDISDTTKYEDHFVNRQKLIAISKSGRSLESEDVQNFLYSKERGIRVELFVRKNKDDNISKEFYYLGSMTASGRAKEFQMTNTSKTAVEIEWILEEPVREDIYEYIVNA